MNRQHKRIRDYILEHGCITQREATNDLGITKLATRISEMRSQGEVILDDWVEDKNRFGEKVRYKVYFNG